MVERIERDNSFRVWHRSRRRLKLEQMIFHDGGSGFYGSREEEINLEYVRVKIAKLT